MSFKNAIQQMIRDRIKSELEDLDINEIANEVTDTLYSEQVYDLEELVIDKLVEKARREIDYEQEIEKEIFTYIEEFETYV